jgi:hypothetical protein
MPKIDTMVNGATTSLDHHGVAGQIAAAAVGAAYVAGRSTIKAIAAKGLQADPNAAK